MGLHLFKVMTCRLGQAKLAGNDLDAWPSELPMGKRMGDIDVDERRDFSMGFRRRTRRRALIAGAVAGGAIAHHENRKYAEQQEADEQAPADDYQEQGQYAPPPADPADEIEHLAQLHDSGALTDEEFAAAKAKALGS